MPSRRRTRRVIEVPEDALLDSHSHRRRHACGMAVFALIFALIAMPVVVKFLGMAPPVELDVESAKLAADTTTDAGLLNTLLRLEQTLGTAVLIVRDALLAVLGWITTGLGWIASAVGWLMDWLRQLPDAAQP